MQKRQIPIGLNFLLQRRQTTSRCPRAQFWLVHKVCLTQRIRRIVAHSVPKSSRNTNSKTNQPTKRFIRPVDCHSGVRVYVAGMTMGAVMKTPCRRVIARAGSATTGHTRREMLVKQSSAYHISARIEGKIHFLQLPSPMVDMWRTDKRVR